MSTESEPGLAESIEQELPLVRGNEPPLQRSCGLTVDCSPRKSNVVDLATWLVAGPPPEEATAAALAMTLFEERWLLRGATHAS